jgi:hypothetical protein
MFTLDDLLFFSFVIVVLLSSYVRGPTNYYVQYANANGTYPWFHAIESQNTSQSPSFHVNKYYRFIPDKP